MDLIFRSPNTHLYPGLRGRLEGDYSPETTPAVRCLVEFSDGNVIPSFLEKQEAYRWKLTVDDHVTFAGTSIPQKSWTVYIKNGEDNSLEFRVIGLTS